MISIVIHLLLAQPSLQAELEGPVVELKPVTATQSSVWAQATATNCIDGVIGNDSSICATNHEDAPWIAIDYGTSVTVQRVEIFNRGSDSTGCVSNGCGERTRNVDVRISDELPTSASQMFSGGTLLGHFAGPGTDAQRIIISGQAMAGRYVIVQINSTTWLNFQEVKAFGRVAIDSGSASQICNFSLLFIALSLVKVFNASRE